MSFELKFFECRHVSIWGFQNRVCLSVCLHPEKRNHHSFVNISPTLVIDASMERSSRVLQHGNPKIWFFFQKSLKFEIWLLTKSWNHLSFVNISPTLVIDTSMEWSSRVLHHGNPEMWKFFQKVRNWRNWILSVPRVSVCRETKLPWLRQYQSYISNWYVNGKVFTSTSYNMRTKKFDLKKKKNRNWVWLVFWLVLKSLNQHSSRSLHAPIFRHRGCIAVHLRVDI